MVQRKPVAPVDHSGCVPGGGVWVHPQTSGTLRRYHHADIIPRRNLDEGAENVDSASYCFQPHCR